MELAKVNIGLLQGKENWSTWKFKVQAIFRGIAGAERVVNGTAKAPEELPPTATAAEKAKYEKDLESFNALHSMVFPILTTNMTEETLKKVMRFSLAHEIWNELQRLYEGTSEDRAYDLCIQFSQEYLELSQGRN
ncbi:unnamed protein product [Nesidiocoris tenuis]|uniref:DUF4219 domain-containing protein n=1 Tax=Nesidiocoris tenuis TaxID=355587 RepID=A0A6H5FYV9_9HEMI|nr:unnamed protein product [Nesidiocoris tenuis]